MPTGLVDPRVESGQDFCKFQLAGSEILEIYFCLLDNLSAYTVIQTSPYYYIHLYFIISVANNYNNYTI